MSREVIIIGAGPGGLATGMLLAAAGVPVRIMEHQAHVGGRTSSIRSQGFKFDLGPTFFLYPEILRKIFRDVGRDLDHEVELVKLDPQYRLVFGSGGELIASPDIAKLREAVAEFCPEDAEAVPRFMAENRRKLALFKPCLESPFLGLGDVLNPRLMKLLPMLRPWNSLDRELRRHFRDPRVRLAFSFHAKYLGMSPFKCPGLFSILSFLEYEHGVFHPVGGCAAICEAMARILRDMDVPIHLDEPVEKITFEGRKATGVVTRNGHYPADSVVINADFAAAMSRLVPNHLRRRWTDRKLAKKKYSCSTFMLYLGIEGREHLPHHNVYLSTDYTRNLEDIEQHFVLSDDPSCYVQNACVTEPGLAPEGHSTLYILVPVPHMHANVDWEAEAPRFRGVAMEQVAKLGFTDLEKRIRFERMITPADWEKSGPIYRGATFNLSHSLGQMLHQRPRNRFEDLESVYLVGGGTHPGSGLPVIFESARITSRLLIEDLKAPARSGRPSLDDRLVAAEADGHV